MVAFDYFAEAELFLGPSPRKRNLPMRYRRFSRAVDAIQYAMEELPPSVLAGACLEIDERRFDAREIGRLYDQKEYPLPRKAPDPGAGTDVASGASRTPRKKP
jgi:hypothetical protein